MNHLPFETWILSEETLAPDQVLALQEHLRACDSCRGLGSSWSEVRKALSTAPNVTPATGFAARWQERLVEQRRKRQVRQSWIMLSVTAGVTVLLFLLLGVQVLDLLRSPGQLLLLTIYRLTFLVAYVQATQNLVFSILGTVANLVPPPVWIGLFGTFSMICALWFVTLKQLTSSRRINI